MAQAKTDSPFIPLLEQKKLAGGLNVHDPATLIDDSETPDCLNIEFDNGALETTGGMRKFGNQVAPGTGLRTRVDPGLAPLPIMAGKSVPLRGDVAFAYNEDYDIGGLFDFEGTFPASDTFHNRRGHSFELNISFRLPIEERLFEQDTKGANAPVAPDANYNPFHGFDEALDEFWSIVQKGGDRTAPMSWALGGVNIGKQALGDASGITAPVSRPSNYCPCFVWFDAAEAGELVVNNMRYSLTSGAAPTAGAFSTRAFRGIIFHKFFEPGKRYSLVMQVQLDSGSPGGVASNTAWNHDGYVKFWCSEDGAPAELIGSFIDSVAGGTTSGIDVYKGPQDSLRYLAKYGVRYAGRDSMFAGLGMRSHPWQTCGFIPYGADAAPLEFGGWRMIDRSANTVATIYGGGVHTLTGYKVNNADAFIRINHAGLTNGNTNGGIDPMATYGAAYANWSGLGAGVTANFNPEALRGYRLVTTADFNVGAPNSKGAIFSILSYAEAGVNFDVTILGGSSINAFGAIGNQKPLLVQSFRWNQRELELGELRIWKTPRAYDTADPVLAARRKLSIHSTIDLADTTEPDRENLLACWRFDDAGGQIVRELVVGGARAGFLRPFGMGVADGGTRGKKQVFLSGQGEALILDLSENPVAKRELEAMLRGDAQGFGVEITCIFPEAFYAIMSPVGAEGLPDGPGLTGNRPRFVPDIITWEAKSPSASGLASVPRPILTLTHRALRSDSANTASFTRPAGFSAEFAALSDQTNTGPIVHSDLLPWFLSGGVNVSRYDTSAAWVGKPVTMVVGLQSTGVTDTYVPFIAMHPKQDFMPGTADPGDAEFAYRATGGTTYDFSGTYYQGASMVIRKRDLVRSVITIGGAHNPGGKGYAELSCPIILDEVRVHGASPPGALPTTNGGVVLGRDGKLEGLKCLPPRLLTEADIKQPLGRGLRTVNITQGSATVTPSSAGRFFTEAPQDTKDSVSGAYVLPEGDVFDVPKPEVPGFEQNEFYRASTVAADGRSLTLANPLNDATRRAAGASVFRLLGYTAFEDAMRTLPLPLAGGKPYDPATSTTADALITEPLFKNLAPVSVDFRARVYGPGAVDVLPRWTRGLVTPRRAGQRDGILGISSVADTIYAGARGALFEADDRWRAYGPTPLITRSLAFRARTSSSVSDLFLPLQDDRLEFRAPLGLVFQPSPTHAYSSRWDAWVRPETTGAYQTILWVGDPTTDSQKTAGTNRIHMIQRLSRGRPELVLGSTAATSSGVPEKGLYIATAAEALADGEDTHIRWVLVTRSSGGVSVLLKPYCFVNGKRVMVAVNGVESNAAITQSTDWLRTSTIVQPGALGIAAFGAARDAYKAPIAAASISGNGPQLSPQRIQGWLHSLGGSLAQFVATTDSTQSLANFDPFALTYDTDASVLFNMLGPLAEGVGHHVFDAAAHQYGVIRSHPFISLWHEFGRSEDMISFARFGQQLYAVNGERVALINGDRASHAGVLPPLSELGLELTRFPLWDPNVRATSGTNPDNDPIVQAVPGAAKQINHYKTPGNNYLLQALSGADATQMVFEKDDYWHFKCYWKPQSIAGRVNIWRKAISKESGGPFVECRDGALVIGWFDTYLKREVVVQSSSPCFKVGDLHYINLRVRWPENNLTEGNWENSFYTDGRIRKTTFSGVPAGTFQVGERIYWPAGAFGAGTQYGIVIKQYGAGSLLGIEYVLGITNAGFPTSAAIPTAGQVITGDVSGATGTAVAGTTRPMHNIAIVRRFRRSAPAAAGGKDEPLDALISATALTDNWSRNLVSFTTANGPAGCTATGMVTPPGAVFTGAPAGVVNAGVAAQGAGGQAQAWADPAGATGFRLFHPDMCGMLFQFATGAFAGIVYRIVAVPNGATLNVAALDGSVPNLTGPVNVAGGVFAGTALVKGEQFDASHAPDSSSPDIHAFGTALQSSPINGFAPHEGEVWTPGWGVTAGSASGTNALCFENYATLAATAGAGREPMAVGTDRFTAQNYDSTGEPGPLRFDNGLQFFCTDGQVYTGAGWTSSVTTQPNAGLEVLADPHSPNTEPTCTASLAAATKPIWKQVQSAATWAAPRYFAVAFFDLNQGISSNPGPVLRVVPAGEDSLNPSGAVRALLKALPVARDVGEFEIHVYCSAANGDAASLFRVARVPNLTAEVAVQAIEEKIGDGLPLEFDNGEPPECRVIALSNGRLFAAALTALEQLDGIVPSKDALPAQFRYSDGIRLNTGADDSVKGLLELDGLLLAMKREGVFSITLNADGTLLAKIITNGAGCVAHQSLLAIDGRAIWRGDNGLVHAARGGTASDLAQVAWLSEKIERLFKEDLDPAFSDRSSACANRLRGQYLVTVKSLASNFSDERIAAMGPIFGRYRDPRITALATVRDPAGGIQRIVGGTHEGFLVWMDREDTALLCMGTNEEDSGSSAVRVAGAGSTSTAILLGSGYVDTDLDGLRGTVVRWRVGGALVTSANGARVFNVGGTDYQATILSCEGGILHLSEPVAVLPDPTADATVGGQVHVWTSKQFDFGAFALRKRFSYLDVEVEAGSTGLARFEFMVDRRDVVATEEGAIPLNGRRLKITKSTALLGNHLQVRISSEPLTAGARWKITALAWKVQLSEQET